VNNSIRTAYLRDASGNIMAVYQYQNGVWSHQEQHLYGADRLGVHNRPVALAASGHNYMFLATKKYELSNHLGNVMAVVTDRRFVHSSGGFATAEVVSATDYFVFGSAMPSREYNGSAYDFGFNTQMESPEILAGHTMAMYWEYDGRIGRRWELDRVVKEWESGYACFSGNPLIYADPNGDSVELPSEGNNGCVPNGSTPKQQADPFAFAVLDSSKKHKPLTTSLIRGFVRNANPALDQWQINISAGLALEECYRIFTSHEKGSKRRRGKGHENAEPRESVIPDFIHPTTHRETDDIFENYFSEGGVVEVKVPQNCLTLATSNSQIDRMLNVSAFAFNQNFWFGDETRAGDLNAGSFTFVVPYGTCIGQDIVDAAETRGVNLYVSYSFYNTSNLAVVFSTPERLTYRQVQDSERVISSRSGIYLAMSFAAKAAANRWRGASDRSNPTNNTAEE
jgi:hypothetical protein